MGTQILMAALLFGLALGIWQGSSLLGLSGLFFALAVASATQDIAVDALYLEALSQDDQARYLGVRAPAYRLAMLLVSGPLAIFASHQGWSLTLAVSGLLLLLLAGFHGLWLPKGLRQAGSLPRLLYLARWPLLGLIAPYALLAGLVYARDLSLRSPGFFALAVLASLPSILGAWRRHRRPSENPIPFKARPYPKAFLSFLDQPNMGALLGFILLYRLGESFLLKMKYPFFHQLGVSLEDYGLANGSLGMIAALIAPALGGWLIAKHGLKRWIWPFSLAQNLFNLLYFYVASQQDGASLSFGWLSFVITVEMFGAGLGTAVFMVVLMRAAQPGHRAAHMAIATALMSLSFTLAGSVSGYVAEALGYAPYFALSVLFGVPAMLLIPWLPTAEAQATPQDPTQDPL